jgi:uncharacterized protein with HEPN domain
MQLRTAGCLYETQSRCQELSEFCQGKTKDEFLRDRGLDLEASMLIEMIGGSLEQIERREPTVFARIPDARLIVETRHSSIHDYDKINYDDLWRIAQNRVPLIERTIAALHDNADIDEALLS